MSNKEEIFVCQDCDYLTNRRGKLDRHLDSLKHKIKVHGITCCELTYYNKHRYINHKRSEKHRLHGKNKEPEVVEISSKVSLVISPK